MKVVCVCVCVCEGCVCVCVCDTQTHLIVQELKVFSLELSQLLINVYSHQLTPGPQVKISKSGVRCGNTRWALPRRTYQEKFSW